MKAIELRNIKIAPAMVVDMSRYEPSLAKLVRESPALLDVAMSVVAYVADKDNIIDIEEVADRARTIIARINKEAR